MFRRVLCKPLETFETGQMAFRGYLLIVKQLAACFVRTKSAMP